MNLVSRLLPLNHVLLGLEVSSKKRLFEQIGLLFENSRQIPRARVFDSLFDRESSAPPGWDSAWPFPTAASAPSRNRSVPSRAPRSRSPSRRPDGQPVSLVFAMLVPEHATEAHLELLSELAQMFSDPGLREALLQTQDIQAAHRLITEWSPYAPAQRSAAV
jgi:PTS system nitrogen regulatory IIA component